MNDEKKTPVFKLPIVYLGIPVIIVLAVYLCSQTWILFTDFHKMNINNQWGTLPQEPSNSGHGVPVTTLGLPTSRESTEQTGPTVMHTKGAEEKSKILAASERLIEMGKRAIAGQNSQPLAQVSIRHPMSGSVIPPDLAPIGFYWKDASGANTWLVEITTQADQTGVKRSPLYSIAGGDRMDYQAYGSYRELDELIDFGDDHVPLLKSLPFNDCRYHWALSNKRWQDLITKSAGKPVHVNLYGFDRNRETPALVSKSSVWFRFGAIGCEAPIYYREVGLRFSTAGVRWHRRNLSKPKSKVVLHSLLGCANCHSISSDGSKFGIKFVHEQAFGIGTIEKITKLKYEDIIRFRPEPDSPKDVFSHGRFSQISPDGRYVVSTVDNEIFLAIGTSRPEIASIFFPITGKLAVFDNRARKLSYLPGGAEDDYVQTNPVWTPDMKWIYFCRGRRIRLTPTDEPVTYRDEPKMIYDIYRVPFNNGKGGRPEPVKGASLNGKSNSFPRITPDGKWLVYVQAANGLLSRPKSRLFIVPVDGGIAREMRCNLSYINSWHSFSPNSRWMVFSSKHAGPWTQLFLTYIDEDGRSHPPVMIPNSVPATRQPNLPEFINIDPDLLDRIDLPRFFYQK